MVTERQAELRVMAKTRMEAIERDAVTKIHVSCLEALEQTVTAGLTSAAAQQFIEALPSIETLMQPLSFPEIARDADPSRSNSW